MLALRAAQLRVLRSDAFSNDTEARENPRDADRLHSLYLVRTQIATQVRIEPRSLVVSSVWWKM